jgi:hypothetical protein
MTDAASLPTDRTIFQNAWVVDDVEAAAMRWADQMGVGPFFVTEHTGITDVTYRGQPGELSMIVALAQAGPMQIELIQPTVDQCAYRDSVAPGTLGFHHMCVWTHDIDADTAYFEGLGYPAANRAKANGVVGFAYYDTRPLLGAMLEVVEYNPMIEARFGAIADACAAWDGTRPVRSADEI